MTARTMLVAPVFAVATADPFAITIGASVVGGLLVWSLIRNVAELDRRLLILEKSDRRKTEEIARLNALTPHAGDARRSSS